MRLGRGCACPAWQAQHPASAAHAAPHALLLRMLCAGGANGADDRCAAQRVCQGAQRALRPHDLQLAQGRLGPAGRLGTECRRCCAAASPGRQASCVCCGTQVQPCSLRHAALVELLCPLATIPDPTIVPPPPLRAPGVQSAGLQPNVPIYTSLMDACVKDGSPASVDLAFKLLERMRREGLQPSAVTYGCLLVACERRRDVDRAFQLYQDACDEVGVAGWA